MVALSHSRIKLISNIKSYRVGQRYFTVFCFSLVLLNLSTFLYHLSGASALNAVSNGIGIALVAYSVSTIFRSRSSDIAGIMYLAIACAGATLSVIYNWTETSAIDVLKYLSLYIFYSAGRACKGQIRPIEVRYLYVLAALPIVFLALGSSKVYNADSFSYFPNANTAVLFFSALLFAVAPLYGNRVIFLQLLNAALMNKIGAVLATGVAIGLWIVFPLRKESIIALILVGAGVVAAFLFGAFDRALAAIDNLLMIFNLAPHAVASMSYRELVQLTGTTDLSAFFRLIHWSNIMDLYSGHGIGVMLLGYGAGQTIQLTYAALAPHNDYLRILAEYGLFNFLIFISFLLHILFSLNRGASRVLFIVLCIYFFTENLLDNFTSMAIFFAYAGRVSVTSSRALAGAARPIIVDYSEARRRVSVARTD